VTIPTVLSFILGATVDVALLAYGARRLLAERRFSLSRTIVAGLAAGSGRWAGAPDRSRWPSR
jgi:hypothetical protein